MLNVVMVLGMLITAGVHPPRNVQQKIKVISSKIQEYRVKGETDKLTRLFKHPQHNKAIPYYQIEGRVYDLSNQPIIAGCYVYIYDAYSGYAVKTLYPDINGEFIDTLPMGAYIIQAQGDMYPTFYYTSTGGTERIENAEIVWLTQNTDSINLRIPDGNVIVGTAYDDSTHMPISNSYGSIALIDTITQKVIWKPFSSDSNGNYVIEGVSKGAFKIKFYVSDYENLFFGNTSNWFSAEVVSFVAWADTDTCNINLPPAGQGSQTGEGVITGLLLSDSGDTVRDPWPYAVVFEAATDAYVYANFEYDSATGVYTLSELPTGSYKVRIDPDDYLPQFYNDKDSIQDADPISVTDGDTTYNINFNFHRGGAIAGVITGTDGYGYTGAYNLNVYDSNTGDYIYGTFGSTPDGNFITGSDLPTGTYKAYVYPTDIEAAQWYKDAHSFETADTINVTAPDTTYGINFDFSGWTGVISGTVLNADGDSVKASVDVYFGDVKEFVSSATTDGGKFVIKHLPAGSYVLYIYPWGEDTMFYLYMDQWYDEQDSWDSATRIILNQGDSIDITITLQKGGRFVGSVIDSISGGKIPATAYPFGVLFLRGGENVFYGEGVSDFGTYRSVVVFPDTYKLLLIPISSYDTTSDAAPLKLNPYHYEFYEGSTDFAGATQIILPADSIITCDFNTVKVQGAVEGHVMNGTDPISGKEYSVIAVNPEGYPVAVFTTSDTAEYHIGGLLPGEYYLYLWPYGLWYNQIYSPIDIERLPYNIPQNAQPVTIGNSVVTDINFDITGISEHQKNVGVLPELSTIVRGNILLLSNAYNVKSLRVYDISGREILGVYNRYGSKTLKVSLNNTESGIYFVVMQLEDGKNIIRKIIRLK